jgi:hypothetical protein
MVNGKIEVSEKRMGMGAMGEGEREWDMDNFSNKCIGERRYI